MMEEMAMPLHIDRVETEMDVLPGGGEGGAAGPGDRGGLVPGLTGPDSAFKERLRPLVLEILNEELERLRRRQG
jgi:hypothetical protein